MANDSDSDPDVIPVGCSPFSSGGIRMDHWKADSSVHKCEHADCGKRFDLLVRRHHCRRCGGIFCSEHSKRTMSLTYDAKPTKEGGSLQRVCEACYSVGYYNNSPMKNGSEQSGKSIHAVESEVSTSVVATPVLDRAKYKSGVTGTVHAPLGIYSSGATVAVEEARLNIFRHHFGQVGKMAVYISALLTVWPGGCIFRTSACPLPVVGGGCCWLTNGLTNPDMPTSMRLIDSNSQEVVATNGTPTLENTTRFETRTPRKVSEGVAGYGIEVAIFVDEEHMADSWPIRFLKWLVVSELIDDLDFLYRVNLCRVLVCSDIPVYGDGGTASFIISRAPPRLFPTSFDLPNGKMSILVATMVTEDELLYARIHENKLINYLYRADIGQKSIPNRPSVFAKERLQIASIIERDSEKEIGPALVKCLPSDWITATLLMTVTRDEIGKESVSTKIWNPTRPDEPSVNPSGMLLNCLTALREWYHIRDGNRKQLIELTFTITLQDGIASCNQQAKFEEKDSQA